MAPSEFPHPDLQMIPIVPVRSTSDWRRISYHALSGRRLFLPPCEVREICDVSINLEISDLF
jgi:hypothetical protein